jgi:hypothetical protein
MDEKEVISILITLSCDWLYITGHHFANLFFLAKFHQICENFNIIKIENYVILEVFNWQN